MCVRACVHFLLFTFVFLLIKAYNMLNISEQVNNNNMAFALSLSLSLSLSLFFLKKKKKCFERFLKWENKLKQTRINATTTKSLSSLVHTNYEAEQQIVISETRFYSPTNTLPCVQSQNMSRR